jgi:hypothetical protein
MAAHYRTAMIPARPYKPRDKAKVKVSEQVVQRWILPRLRNRRFFSQAELNRAIGELVDLTRSERPAPWTARTSCARSSATRWSTRRPSSRRSAELPRLSNAPFETRQELKRYWHTVGIVRWRENHLQYFHPDRRSRPEER